MLPYLIKKRVIGLKKSAYVFLRDLEGRHVQVAGDLEEDRGHVRIRHFAPKLARFPDAWQKVNN
jgi:hypothetical protein